MVVLYIRKEGGLGPSIKMAYAKPLSHVDHWEDISSREIKVVPVRYAVTQLISTFILALTVPARYRTLVCLFDRPSFPM